MTTVSFNIHVESLPLNNSNAADTAIEINQSVVLGLGFGMSEISVDRLLVINEQEITNVRTFQRPSPGINRGSENML